MDARVEASRSPPRPLLPLRHPRPRPRPRPHPRCLPLLPHPGSETREPGAGHCREGRGALGRTSMSSYSSLSSPSSSRSNTGSSTGSAGLLDILYAEGAGLRGGTGGNGGDAGGLVQVCESWEHCGACALVRERPGGRTLQGMIGGDGDAFIRLPLGMRAHHGRIPLYGHGTIPECCICRSPRPKE